ncbi:hypothetical protein PENTCL1PPCAC_15072, partial [Pristionchus entomophagus]
DRKWVIYNGYCIRPYLHAGKDVIVRSLFQSSHGNTAVLKAERRSSAQLFEDDLTLLTHSSASALDEIYLSMLHSNWRGPISLAVSLQGQLDEEYVKKKIHRALTMFSNPEEGSRLAVHILVERVRKLTCDRSSRIRREDSLTDTVFFASYPINTVRKAARLFSTTSYIAFADSDYLFSTGFHEKLPILRKHVPLESSNALLYRIFEVDEVEVRLRNYQKTKNDLKTLIDDDKARVFHGKRWVGSHCVKFLPILANAVERSLSALECTDFRLKKRKFWEFQFSGLRDVPLFDENFPYRVDNNLELRWEVCRAGYRLLPVEDLFVYHTLSQDDANKDDSSNKKAIKKKNTSISFKAKKALIRRMKELYPNTKDDCP